MAVAAEEREAYFLAQAKDLFYKYDIQPSKSALYIDGQRIGYLFSNVLIKIYDARVGADAYICLRDWAIRQKLRCDRIAEMEVKNGKDVASPYSTSTRRIFENFSFIKYTTLLEDMLTPERHPLRGRSPRTTLKF